MDNKLLESYLDYIAGQVIEEDKIVTYKSLSRSLNLHVNTAKQLLYTYLTKEKYKSSFPVSATYFIAGKTVDGSFNIAIVNESDLKRAQSNLTQVTSEHVYSVQKGENIKEIKVLCEVHKESSTLNSSNLVIKHSKSLLKQKEAKKKPLPDEAENKKLIKQVLNSIDESNDVTELNKKNDNANNEVTYPGKKTNPKVNPEKVQANSRKPTGSIANLFANANSLKKTEKLVKTETDSQKNAEKPLVDVANDDKLKQELMNSEGIISERRNELKESLKRKKNGSKRRRIQMISDSEESDNDDVEQSMDIDVLEDSSLPSAINLEEENKETSSCNKRKKRKVVDKTVMNEDGYLETKKEVVFETDSENEIDELKKLEEVKKPKIEKMSGKGKGISGTKKQSSLLTFFKKG